jgi:hypothetical protein
MKSNAPIAVLVIGLMAGGGVLAQKKASGATLTPRDYLDIQQLVARYAYAMDSGADNGNAYADLFTDDGEFVLAADTTRGRDALAALGRSGFVDGHKPANGVSHFILNHVIEPAAGGATGKEYVVLVNIGEGGKPGAEWSNTGGHYEDRYVKTPQGWKFKRREYIPMKFERRAPAAAGAAAGAAAAASVELKAQARKATPAPAAQVKALSAQDYIDIRALASQYAYGLDSGAENGTGSVYANVFAEDAEFHGPPATPGGTPFNAVGREELRKFGVPGRGAAYVRHFMTNHLIEPSPEGARGKVYLLVIDIAREGRPTSVNMGGHYEDVYVKTAEGWRIKSRNFYRSKSAQTVAAEAAAAATPSK